MRIKNLFPIVGSYDSHKSCMWTFAWILSVLGGFTSFALLLYYMACVGSRDYFEIPVIPVILSVVIWMSISAGMVLIGIYNKNRSLFLPMIVSSAFLGFVSFGFFLGMSKSYLISEPNFPSHERLYLRLSLAFFTTTVLVVIVLMYLIGLFIRHPKKLTSTTSLDKSESAHVPLNSAVFAMQA